MKSPGNITVILIVLLALVAGAMIVIFARKVAQPTQVSAPKPTAESTTANAPEILDDRLTRRTALPPLESVTPVERVEPRPAPSAPAVRPATGPDRPSPERHSTDPTTNARPADSAPPPAQKPPTTLREACADRPNVISRTLCEQRLCAQPNWRSQPACDKVREENRPPPGA